MRLIPPPDLITQSLVGDLLDIGNPSSKCTGLQSNIKRLASAWQILRIRPVCHCGGITHTPCAHLTLQQREKILQVTFD